MVANTENILKVIGIQILMFSFSTVQHSFSSGSAQYQTVDGGIQVDKSRENQHSCSH